jgi:integrase
VTKGKRRSQRRADVQTVSPDHFDAVLATIKEPYHTMMLLQWAIGLRPGEVCKMRLADLHMSTGELVTPRDGKTGERRLCFDTEGRAAQALRAWMKMRPKGPYVFGGDVPIRVNTYNVSVHRACERAGVPPFRPYALRHTYATELIHEHQAISDISAALGHQSVLTTARYYLHPDPETIRRMNKGR